MDDIYTARLALELAGVDALTSGRDPVAFARLADLTREIEAAVGRQDVAAAVESDRLFHAALVAATGSGGLQRFHARLQQEQRLALSLAERSSRELAAARMMIGSCWTRCTAAASRTARALRAHLEAGAAELHRLRQLIGRRREDEPDDGS